MADNIYIIVAQTGTNVAKAIKFFTKKPYNHVSVAGDIELSKMYSFCRTYRYTPLPATFNEEIIGEGTLGLFNNIPCEIYEIPVSHEQKVHFQRLINNFYIYKYKFRDIVEEELRKRNNCAKVICANNDNNIFFI